MAVVRSALANEAKAGLPLSQARITPLRRLALVIRLLRSGQAALGEDLVQPPIDPAGVLLENLVALCRRQVRRAVDIATRVVEAMPGFGIDALDGADHLGGEEHVRDRYDAGEQI